MTAAAVAAAEGVRSDASKDKNQEADGARRNPYLWEEGNRRVVAFAPPLIVGNAFLPRGSTEDDGGVDRCVQEFR